MDRRPDRGTACAEKCRWDLEKIRKSNRTSKEAEYTGCILVDYKLRSKYKQTGLYTGEGRACTEMELSNRDNKNS